VNQDRLSTSERAWDVAPHAAAARQPTPSQAQMQADIAEREPDLRLGLAALSRLAIGQMELVDVLTSVAQLAVFAIPGADGAAVRLMETGYDDMTVASAPFVGELETIQHRLEDGRGTSDAFQDHSTRSVSLVDDPRSSGSRAVVAPPRRHSVLSLPLHAADRVLAMMNVYARTPDAFDARAQAIGETFAIPAAITVHNAHTLAQTTRLAEQLRSAMTSRAVIDQAIGIIMSRTGHHPDQAFDQLRAISQRNNQKLRTIAQTVVDKARGRAMTRHTRP
jgi:GAF domain-containing protein